MRSMVRARSRIAVGTIMILLGVLLTTFTISADAAVSTSSAACPDFYLLGTRGSGQATADQDPKTNGLGPEVAQFRDAFTAERPAGTTFDFWANPYPGVPVVPNAPNNADGWFFSWVLNLVGAASGRDIGRYHESVEDGVTQLVAKVRDVIATCRDTTHILLAGYSQGAQVTGNAYQTLTDVEAGHVFGMVLFADPRFNGADSAADAGSYSPKRHGAVREKGTFRSNARPVFPPASNGRILSYCHARDMVCQSLFSVGNTGVLVSNVIPTQHTNYTSVGDACGAQTYPQRAAGYFAYRAGNQQASSGPIAVLTPVEDAATATPVTISAASSCEPASRPLTYQWDIDGAGTFATSTGGVAALTTSFSGAGTHTVAVRVTNDQGQSATATTTVNIGGAGVFTGVPAAPTNVVSTPAPDGQSATLTWDPPASGPPAEAYEIYTGDGEPIGGVDVGAPRTFTLPEMDLPLSVSVVPVNRVGDGTPSDPVTMYPVWPPTQPGSSNKCDTLNTLFNAYGDQGGHWTGADATVSVGLPDGRTAWLFSDTFLGAVNADHSRPRNAPFIHNSMVVQNGATLTTLTGGTPAAPASLVGSGTDSQPGDLGWWVGDGTVTGNTLQIFYHHYKNGGHGPLDYLPQGTGIATFSLPDLTLRGLVPLGNNPQIDWGTTLVDGHDGYTYIYGVEAANRVKYLHIARAPVGSVLGAADAPTGNWTYWTGNVKAGANGWSAAEGDAARVMTGVGNGFSVEYRNGQYVLVTMDSDQPFSRDLFAYFATTPTGPFVRQTLLYRAPEANTTQIVYDARLHPEQTCNGSNLVISYNVNSLTDGDNYADAHIYRPRFIVATLPGAPDVSRLPDPPTDLNATVDANATVRLSWTAPTGPNDTNLTYQVYQRDNDIGQKQFTPLPDTTTATSMTVGMVNGGVYDFRVTARNAAGESAPSQLIRVEVQIPPPTAAPTNLAAQSLPIGDIALSWTPVSGAGWIAYQVYQKDLTANDTDYSPAVTTGLTTSTATVTSLTAGHTYQFVVSAHNSGGEGPKSAPVTATATVAPPTNLTATPLVDGRIQLAWNGLGPEYWYWIYYHDDTADPQNTNPFSRAAYPITSGTGFTMSYLTGGHTYSFQVSAISAHGESTRSNRATATSPLPTTPTLNATARGDGGIDLSWTAPSPDYWYWIYYHDDTADPSGANGFSRYSLPSTRTTFTATPLYIGHTYSYYVTSIAPGGGESAPSNHASATAFLPAPTNLNASAGDGQILLRWDPPLPGMWYWVYTQSPGSGTFTRSAYPITSGSTLTVSPVGNGQTYSFYVTTIGPGGGESAPSNVVSATPRATPPSAPTGVSARAAVDGSITVSWNRTGPNDWYWVYTHDDTADPHWQVGYAHGPYPVTTASSQTFQGLVNGHAYSFYVTTIGAATGTESAPSDVVRAWAYLAPPTNLTASANIDGSVTLGWGASAGDVSYYWIYQKAPGGSFSRLPYPVHNQTSFVLTGVPTGSTYQYYVTAAGSFGDESNPSNTASVVPTLARPSSMNAYTDGWGDVTIAWTTPFSGALYWIYFHDDTADPFNRQPYSRTVYPANERSATGFAMGGLVADDTYSFYVTTAYAGNESAPSTSVTVNRRVATPTGLHGWTVAENGGSAQCEAVAGPNCHVHLTWNGVVGADHYDVYRLLVTSDETTYKYIGSSYGTTFDMPVGAQAQWRASYQVRAFRSINPSTSPPSDSTTLTIGDYNGGDSTDCYIMTEAPYSTGATVHFTTSSVCPRSVPAVEITFSRGLVDCSGEQYECPAMASTPLRAGSHSYCTLGNMHIPTYIGSKDADGLSVGAYSRCVTLSG
jgi:fibronectin type 3 domain-containing protein